MKIHNTLNLKVIFVINDFIIGGAQKIFINTINSLHYLGVDVYLVILYGVSKGEKNYLASLKISKNNILSLSFKGFFDFKSYYQVLSFIKEKNISIIFSTLNESNIFSRVIGFLRPSLKIYTREANVAKNKSWKYKILDLLLNLRTNKIIGVSKQVKDSLARYQPFFRSKITILENGTFLPKVAVDYDFARPINLLNVARLTPQKGHIFLLKSFLELNKKYPGDYNLILIGEGGQREQLEKYIKNNNLTGVVKLKGEIDYYNMEEVFLSADIFILSSAWEGCPNALLEAMSYGLPVISTRISGAVDIIEDGVNGLLVDYNSASQLTERIRFLTENKTEVIKMGNAARETIRKRYSWDDYINKLMKIFLR